MKRLITALVLALVAITNNVNAESSDQVLAVANTETQPYMESIATTGYIYGLPYLGMYEMLIQQVVNDKVGFNTYVHDRLLATPKTDYFPSPNNDTLYSRIWLDLRTEPAVLEFPKMGDRYFSIQLFDINSDLVGYIGTRESGKDGGKFLVVGPNWDKKIPKGFKKVYRAKSNFVLGLGRTLISGPAELDTVHKIQNQYMAASLSQYRDDKSGGGSIAGLPEYKNKSPMEFFVTLSSLLKINPIMSGEDGIIADLNNIGVGPMIIDKPNYKYNDDTIQDGFAGGVKSLNGALQFWGKFINGWKVTISGVGTYGFDYMQRAVVWKGGALANDPKEAVYPTALFDADGNVLNGNNDYVLKFTRDQLPPVNYFWSMTMYDIKTTYLVPNDLDKYSIGDRTPGIKYGPDGGLTIYLSNKNPGPDKESNWLPTPRGPFYMVLRLYGPKDSVLDGKWQPAGIQKVTK